MEFAALLAPALVKAHHLLRGMHPAHPEAPMITFAPQLMVAPLHLQEQKDLSRWCTWLLERMHVVAQTKRPMRVADTIAGPPTV